jgi:predicted nucleotide-binding protein
MSAKPRIFIGSSKESLPIADGINQNLDHDFEVTIWRNNTFDLASYTLDSLIKKTQSVDYAIFIFSPDDLVTIREEKYLSVRDNVVFELGLFIGVLGKERCFVVKPRDTALHLPTDLLGLTTGDYNANRSDGDWASALNYACSLVKSTIGKIDGTKSSDHTYYPM